MSQQTKASESLMKTYNRLPLTVEKGMGSYLFDTDGKPYLDFTSGIATCNLGHQPQAVKQAVTEQLDSLWHCSNLFNIPKQEELANLLTKNSCFDEAFFCNSGTEANEAAIKLVRKWSGKESIVTFTNSFHGRTLGSLSATAQTKLHEGFGSMISGFHFLAFNDFESIAKIEELMPAAVMFELVQGEGGVRPADKEWINELIKVCKRNGILVIVDEVQTGIGRSGTLFAYEQYGFEPDVMTLAKGLGSGFPIGAMLAKSTVASTFGPGTHGSTFGGNPLASAAGVETIQQVIDLLPKVQEIAAYLDRELRGIAISKPSIVEVRGLGLLIGLEVEDAGPFLAKFREKDVLILTAGPNVLRILPPLIVSREEVNQFTTVLKELLQ
ncbi:acetylornithine transaminase [Guptibacillus algicola]|uniref:acetylornithine transaminase n=1 Tax=Guptibacillus algicola TaxID=225844 RepID=UPI001CD3238D|nr:acetylornithine transaminase [Alkalihalobacillus algicola]MCA0988265.1 acetylornithine transaminase [Alkalihalobacillus algicola]